MAFLKTVMRLALIEFEINFYLYSGTEDADVLAAYILNERKNNKIIINASIKETLTTIKFYNKVKIQAP